MFLFIVDPQLNRELVLDAERAEGLQDIHGSTTIFLMIHNTYWSSDSVHENKPFGLTLAR